MNDLEEEFYSYRHCLNYVEALKEVGPGAIESILDPLPPESVKAINLYRNYFK